MSEKNKYKDIVDNAHKLLAYEGSKEGFRNLASQSTYELPITYTFDITKNSNITLSKSTVETLMARIDKVDKSYLKQINDVTVFTAHGQEIKSITGIKRIVLGTIADLLLEFLPRE